MAASKMLGLAVLLLVALDPFAVEAMRRQEGWTSLVSGNVFCDQCMKNAVFPFALPMHGAKVSVQCGTPDGQRVEASADATTDFFGGFLVTFKDVADLEGCRVYMETSTDSSCSTIAPGDQGGRAVELRAKLFFSSFYAVEPMFFKPSTPKPFCPGAPHPPLPPLPPKPPVHGIPPLPPISIPPNPWKEPSTCSADEWTKSEFFCHWKKVSPLQTTVGMMFGRAARRTYGDMTLYQALQGQDDLLKQAVAATMNSYVNPKFSMSPRGVKREFLLALTGTQQLKWDTAWKLKQANTGWGKGKCYLTPCKP